MIILPHTNFIFFIWPGRQVHHFEIHQKMHGGFSFSFGQYTVMFVKKLSILFHKHNIGNNLSI
jgi:hypothetical protein